ncbi:hypothetical protein H0H92_005879 [Tricholoma furcatifolium]|nr:hypothetical protein H0H92_005879 [Tricholoma furcatifolium]
MGSVDSDLVKLTYASAGPKAHILTMHELADELGTSLKEGLSRNEAERRLQVCGANVLAGDDEVSAILILFKQIANVLTIILIASMALSFGVKDWIEGGVIAAVIAINTFVGFFQEYRAEKTMDSLKKLSSPSALVIRSGERMSVPAKDIVPGDLIIIKTGDLICADLRLISLSNLEVSEQVLTGESLPVAKTEETFNKEALNIPVMERSNICFSSTIVTKGRATGLVVSTGMKTEIGQIAEVLSRGGRKEETQPQPFRKRVSAKLLRWLQVPNFVNFLVKPDFDCSGLSTGTPLQIKLNKLAYILFGWALILIVVVFAASDFKVDEDVVLYAVATALSIIPEALVAVLTLTMAAGTRRMAKENVIVRKLDSLENLGGVTDVCSDKTGTLTLGKMSVRSLWLAADLDNAVEYVADIVQDALNPGSGAVRIRDDEEVAIAAGSCHEGPAQAVRVAALCNIATIRQNSKGQWMSTGDPTEVALQVFAAKLGLGRPTLTREAESSDEIVEEAEKSSTESQSYHPKRFELRVEFPFSSELKRMSTIYWDNVEKKYICLIKGATERILDLSNWFVPSPEEEPFKVSPLSEMYRGIFLAKADELASQGLRVIGMGMRTLPLNSVKTVSREDVEKDFTFLAMAGIFDPPRPETLGAVRAFKGAGIVVHMLTGDHLTTARAIAESVEIIEPDVPKTAVMTAVDFDRLSNEEIDALPELPLVIARCAPETKVRMIHAGQRRGKHLSMSGDGINDSPALKLAPVGIAMGLTGSDVARDAADLVLTDE